MPVHLEILTGPDQGKTFPLGDELLHIGRGADNGAVLSDPQLGDFHATISHQEGQLALFANEANQIRVGKTLVPGQEWVAVPPEATIHLGGQTQVRVVLSPEPKSNGAPADKGAPAEKPAAPATGERRRPPKKESKRQEVARPITTRSGENAVQMGADGKFPELALSTGTGPAKPMGQRKESNPAVLFAILAASCLSTAAMLLIDFDSTTTTSSSDQAFARSRLAGFYGTDADQLEPYQVLLRRAAIEYSQGHRSQERKLLKEILSLLNSVDAAAPENLNGLTGRQTGRGKASDKELLEILQQVLN